ncbi:MAG: hypothetical protein ABI651_07230 [Verrucomicrobiota bacterium]
MLPNHVLYYGSEAAPAKTIPLTAGQLKMIFVPDRAFLRYVRLGDHEIVRGIYAAVRDRNWNTVPPQISNLNVQSTENTFRVSFEVENKEGDIDFGWTGLITGDADGKITYAFDGEARSTFLKNRIGICVLHPILECAGKTCTLEDTNGKVVQGAFPRYISARPPLQNIRAIRHEVVAGIEAEVRFEGDVFEMEDQRNWTDASFKTYSTPVDLPFPVQVEKGSRIRQSVTISLLGQQRKILPVVQGRTPQFSISTTPVLSKPPIGLKCANQSHPLSTKARERLKKLRLSHLRVDLDLADLQHREMLSQAVEQSKQIGVPLHIALFLSDRGDEELSAFLHELEAARPTVALWLVFHRAKYFANEKWVRLAREKLAVLGPNILFASGTNANFAELNQNRPQTDSSALPCYSINPQGHATDNLTLVENLGAQGATVESTQQFCPRAVVISPITLRSQCNPYATGNEPPPVPGELPSTVDPRQMSLLGAGWTLGSLARLATAGNLHSLTYYETTGWRGVMETENGSHLPDKFWSLPDGVFPLYHVLADIADFNRIYPTHSSHPLQVEGMTVVDDKSRRRILIANLIGEPQEVKITTGTCQARVRYLDERNAEAAMLSPEDFSAQPGELVESVSSKIELNLLPYAYARVDIV